MNVVNAKPILGLTFVWAVFPHILCHLSGALFQPVICGDFDPFRKSGISVSRLSDRADTLMCFHGHDAFMNHLAGGRARLARKHIPPSERT